MSHRRTVAEWRTSGSDYLVLYEDEFGYSYTGLRCGGFFGSMVKPGRDEDAIAAMECGPVSVLRSCRSSLRRVS